MIFHPLCFNFLVLLLVMTFSSCVRYEKLVKTEFPQGTSYDDNREVTHNNVRSTTIYDQFSTKGFFDGLRLSDEVRTAYVDLYCRKRGITGEARKATLNRHLEENKHWISFYLLADVRDKTYISLSEKGSSWTVYLDVGNKVMLQPEFIKEVDLEPEYQAFFAHRFNLFKTAYLIKFPIMDIHGKRYEGDDVDVKLAISSPYKKGELVWKFSQTKTRKKLNKDEDFYWG